MKRKEAAALRKFGLELVGDVPWGTHLCQFYESKEDLIDILVPYFTKGLRNNEFCMWVTSQPLEVGEAKKELRKVVPNLDEYLMKKQIEILSYKDWYLLGGKFDLDRVLNGWMEKEKYALDNGFEGLRLTGNTFWIERNAWQSFTNYEASINFAIKEHRIIALCTYSLEKYSATDMVDVIKNHVGTLIKKEGKWCIVEDWSERKKAEEELRRANKKIQEEARQRNEEILREHQRLYSVLETLPTMICLLTPDHHVAFANRSFREKFGESHGRHCYEYCFGRTEPCDFCEAYNVLKTGKPHHWEVAGPNGSVIDAYDFPFTDVNGSPMILEMDIDITERKEMEDKLEEYSKHLEELVEERTKQLRDAERLVAIGQTAGMVGHDIRNPLQSIIGDVYLAKMDLASLPDSEEKGSVRESLEAIGKQTEYINKIVLDLQDFAKPLNPHAEETNLERLIEELLVRNEVPENIQTEVEVDVDAKKVMADSAYMKRIMGNLISNGIQAMPDGGKLAIRAYREAGEVVITVEDTGVGVPDEAKPKMFQPLFTTKSKGQGFGLAVVKRLTEALDGTITFDSQEGKGTKFIIKLPMGR